jgi:Tfp pilus assembly protein PilO
VMFGLVVAVVCAPWWFMVWTPKQSTLHDARSARSAEEGKTDGLKSQLRSLQDIQRQGPRTQAELMRLQGFVPKDPQLASFIRTANDIASQSGITWLSISPSVPAPSSSGGPTTIGLQFQLQGTFFEVVDYIHRMEKIPRLVKMNNLSLTAGAGTSATGSGTATGPGTTTPTADPNKVQITLSLSAEMYTTQVPPGAATVAPGSTSTGTTGTTGSTGTSSTPTTTAPSTSGGN